MMNGPCFWRNTFGDEYERGHRIGAPNLTVTSAGQGGSSRVIKVTVIPLSHWKQLAGYKLLRRRRCFEIAKPRRSAGGAQLNRSLGELEGPIRDPVLARFPKVAAFSSAESGSGEPPDRAQICAPLSDETV
mgnify:CR=1 FL=1